MTKINERIRILREGHLFSQEQIAEKYTCRQIDMES